MITLASRSPKSDALTPRITKAWEDVERERATLAEWETKRAAAEADLESTQAGAGTRLLDDPSAESDIAAEIAKLHTAVTLADRAIAAQRPRVTSAESRYLTAEADALEPGVEVALKALTAHEAKTEKLLKQLADHECEFVPKHLSMQKSLLLREELTFHQQQLAVARELAAGRDPEELIRSFHAAQRGGCAGSELYPPYVTGPQALVKAPQFLRSVERARALLDDLVAAQSTLELEVEEWTERERLQDVAAPVALARRRARLEEIPGEITEARNQLAALTGTPT